MASACEIVGTVFTLFFSVWYTYLQARVVHAQGVVHVPPSIWHACSGQCCGPYHKDLSWVSPICNISMQADSGTRYSLACTRQGDHGLSTHQQPLIAGQAEGGEGHAGCLEA